MVLRPNLQQRASLNPHLFHRIDQERLVVCREALDGGDRVQQPVALCVLGLHEVVLDRVVHCTLHHPQAALGGGPDGGGAGCRVQQRQLSERAVT